jgi:NAD(P)-dependent dehydrogenase (short-subunit alcohol dehydrogenase family)
VSTPPPLTKADGVIAGRTILLTGASGGIGSVTARTLLDRGAYVIAHYGSDRAGAQRACESAPPDRWTLVHADLAERGAGRALWRDALQWRGRVDVIVANAAVAIELPYEAADDEWDLGWERTLRVNVQEPANLIRAALPVFIGQGGGVVIAISSWAAQRGSALIPHIAYAASKAALQNVAQSIARNHARDGVLVHIVAPGIVRTPMSEISARYRGGVDAVNAILPLGEMVPPEEVAELVAHLASGACRHLTGATLDLNGAANIR